MRAKNTNILDYLLQNPKAAWDSFKSPRPTNFPPIGTIIYELNGYHSESVSISLSPKQYKVVAVEQDIMYIEHKGQRSSVTFEQYASAIESHWWSIRE